MVLMLGWQSLCLVSTVRAADFKPVLQALIFSIGLTFHSYGARVDR